MNTFHRRKRWSLWCVLPCLLLLSGCAARHYARTEVGQLSGRMIVEWRRPNLFVYRPADEEPLVFVRKSGDAITPGGMFADGGSIPRPFWVLKNYSPWGYGPAFIVHDWLFHMQDCNIEGYEKYTIESAAAIMSEVMKTMMETPGFDYGNERTVYLTYKAVLTQPARDAWEDGICQIADLGFLSLPADEVFVVEFPPK